ncbi:Ser-Thr-rich glycosyl-phosphatidyl-inositol-anchored membrane family-domain-containing protein [Xylaria palmicola]|nr:Ser-Thr-rich glycosyl-phosphatidyl-inositol-anchored membrane family-domain-containing protein [Xylaria palmicola]
MKATVSSVVLAALLGFVNAKVHLTNSNFDDIEAGQTFEITWDEAEGPVTLTLKDGEEGDLQDVATITTNAAGNSFVWAVDPSLPSGDYAIEIDDGADINYSAMFPVEGTDEPVSSTATSASSTVSITSSATPSSTSSSESSSTESTTSSESSSTVTSSSQTSSSTGSTSTSASSSATRTTSSTPTATESDAAETSVPNSNDARSMAAPLVPGILAIIGAALI